MYDEYGELSTIFYESTKPAGHSIEGDIEYYIQKLEGIPGPVLEAGVGTGRVLIPLIQKGIWAEGVDSSAAMLAQCRINLKKHGLEANLYQQDLMRLSLANRYDAIIMPAGSFCLLPRKRAEEVLKIFHRHLNENGKIIIDLDMPGSFREGTISKRMAALPDGRQILLTGFSGKIDWLLQKASSVNRYELIEKGKLVKTEVSEFILYWYGIEEFAMRLASAGYGNISHEIGYGREGAETVTFLANQ